MARFTAEFIEERMRRHQLWQHQQERQLISEIIEEIQDLPRKTRPRASEFFDFDGATGNHRLLRRAEHHA